VRRSTILSVILRESGGSSIPERLMFHERRRLLDTRLRGNDGQQW